MLQPAGDRGAGAPRALQDPHRDLAAGHGGGQPPALVPRQQVGPTTQLYTAISVAVAWFPSYHLYPLTRERNRENQNNEENFSKPP